MNNLPFFNLPPAVARPSDTPHPRKRPERTLIETLLSTTPQPLDAPQIARRTGADLETVRSCLTCLIHDKKVHRAEPLPGEHLTRYAWGKAAFAVPVVEPVSRISEHTYDGRDLKPFAGRPGALDAFTLPSLQGGHRIERRAPTILGSAVPPERTR